MSNNKWSVRTVNSKKGQYCLVTGKAYPEVKAGKNATTTVHAHIKDREAFYHDPAIQLSEADMDDIDGATGAPLCVEHNKNDVVGYVHHSWIEEDNGRCLQIIGRIPMNGRGKKVFEEIQCGKYKGFSVGYGATLHATGPGTHKMQEKVFREISLVSEPFFKGCDLTMSVMASKSLEGDFEEIGILGNNFAKILHVYTKC